MSFGMNILLSLCLCFSIESFDKYIFKVEAWNVSGYWHFMSDKTVFLKLFLEAHCLDGFPLKLGTFLSDIPLSRTAD